LITNRFVLSIVAVSPIWWMSSVFCSEWSACAARVALQTGCHANVVATKFSPFFFLSSLCLLRLITFLRLRLDLGFSTYLDLVRWKTKQKIEYFDWIFFWIFFSFAVFNFSNRGRAWKSMNIVVHERKSVLNYCVECIVLFFLSSFLYSSVNGFYSNFTVHRYLNCWIWIANILPIVFLVMYRSNKFNLYNSIVLSILLGSV
jgi:hypothetical protein